MWGQWLGLRLVGLGAYSMPVTTSDKLAPDQIGVKVIPTSELHANPHNPRVLFDKAPLKTLCASIDKVGILVPLTVYFAEGEAHWVILDGQRRWICAQRLGLAEVPVNQVAEPSLVENIITMFQIHKLREDWELMPSALKLEVLMDALEERNDTKLAELTGLDRAVVARCKKLLSYPRDIQDLMLDPDPEQRVRADFFIELHAVRNDRFVNGLKWFKKRTFTEQMLAKYQDPEGPIRSVTDFRLVKQHITNARRSGHEEEISQRLQEFASEVTVGVDHLLIKSADVEAQARDITRQIIRFRELVSELDPNQYLSETDLWEELTRLAELIAAKLEELQVGETG